jgi:hypothetical protein
VDDQAVLSPYTLAHIVNHFGQRPLGPVGGASRFPLRECPGVARPASEAEQDEPRAIEIVEIGLDGLVFRTRGPVYVNKSYRVALEAEQAAGQVWKCHVTTVETQRDGSRLAHAHFEASEPGPPAGRE